MFETHYKSKLTDSATAVAQIVSHSTVAIGQAVFLRRGGAGKDSTS